MGSYAGVDRIQLDAERNPKSIAHFGIAEGFTGSETTQNAGLKDRNGNLWFGTTNGLMQFTPGNAIVNPIPPALHMVDVQLGYTSLQKTEYADWIDNWGHLKDGLQFPYNQNDLSFEFLGINLQNPTSVRYQWKLENNDEKWSPLSNQTSVRYSNLNPGNYTFLLRAYNENDMYNDPPIAISFSITPPYWQTWWFQLGSILLGLLIIFGIFRIRVNRIRRKAKAEKEKLELENHLLELEQKALQLQMNPHFIFNALNSIQGLIVKKEPAKARFQLAKFSKLMRSILENSRSEMITLENEIELLENYLTIEKNSNNDRFDFELDVDERLDPEAVLIPPMMIQPFVENAIIHGIHTVENGLINITFTQMGKLLECTITDNGIGREAAKARKSQKDQQHKSAALEVTQERLDILQNGKLGKKKSLEILDVVDAEGKVAGTRVVLRMPLMSDE